MNNNVFENLISFDSLQKNDETGAFELPFSILETSKVFEGHFPGQPILHGVVMVEITKRAIELATGEKLTLVEAGNFKFLRMIDPTKVAQATLHFSVTQNEDIWKLKAQIKHAADIYFKASATYSRA